MAAPLIVDDWPVAPIRTPRLVLRAPEARDREAIVLAWADEVLGEPVVLCTQKANLRSLALADRLGFTEVARFEEFGAEQWYGVRQPGNHRKQQSRFHQDRPRWP